jgi:hypothetical protein
LIIGLVTLLGGLWNYQNELNYHLSAAPSQPVIAAAAQKSAPGHSNHVSKSGSGKDGRGGPAADGGSAAYASGGSAGTSAPRAGSVLPATTPGGSGRTASSGLAAVSIISVSLSINGQAQGHVQLSSGSTQCDVLSQALAQGVIHSLDMRYSSQLGTEGIYVINGIGDPSTVQWVYEVNGSYPDHGCGYVTARAGDSINWKHI